MGLRLELLIYKYYSALDKGDFSQALEIAQKAVDLFPKDPNAYAYLGEAYFITGKYDFVLDAFSKRQVLLASKKDPLQTYIDGYRACVMLEQKKIEEAKILLEAVIANNPQEPQFYYSLAKIYWKNGDKKTAKSLFQKVESLDPCFCHRKIQRFLQVSTRGQ